MKTLDYEALNMLWKLPQPDPLPQLTHIVESRQYRGLRWEHLNQCAIIA